MPEEVRRAGYSDRFRSIVRAGILRGAEAELELHRQRGHRLRAFLARRRLERLRSGLADDGVPNVDDGVQNVRDKIAPYSAKHSRERPQGERRSGRDRRSGEERRRYDEQRFSERRSGVERRSGKNRRQVKAPTPALEGP